MIRRSDPNDDVEWSDVVEFMNSETGMNYNRDFVRKSWPLLSMYINAGWVNPPGGISRSYFEDKYEADKAKILARDERNELARMKRDMARKESMVDLWKQVVSETVSPDEDYAPPHIYEASGSDLIVHLTDLHAGLNISNFTNKFNENILRDRMQEYLDKIGEIQFVQGAENCYLLLGGDMISGGIHTPLRIEANMDVMGQVKLAPIMVTSFVKVLSGMFTNVYVYSVAGNHSRLFPNKKESAKGENLDVLIPFYVAAKLEKYENVYVEEENEEESVARFKVRGHSVFGVHGDKDNMETVVQKLTMFFGEKPDIVLAGHRHTNGMRTVYDTKVIESGCVSGPDNFCMDHRLVNKPEQMVVVVKDYGVDCIYDVKFN